MGIILQQVGTAEKKQPVYVYSAQNGDFIERYSSLTLASIETEVPIETISAIINESSNRRQAHNLIFSKEYFPHFDLKQLARNNYCSVYVYDSLGNFIKEFSSIIDASKYFNLSYSTIRRYLNDKTIWDGKYYFRRNYTETIISFVKGNNAKPVLQINPLTGEILNHYLSLKDAAKAVGLASDSGIVRVLKKGKGTSGGYFWKIDEGSTTKRSENPAETVRDPIKMGEDIV